MKANNLPVYYSEYTEKKPSDYTSKLQSIVVLSVRKHYESFYHKKTGYGHKNFTYVYYKTKEDSLYPARNGGYLDGLVGCIKLIDFRKTFIPSK
jgi:hypothetical protein